MLGTASPALSLITYLILVNAKLWTHECEYECVCTCMFCEIVYQNSLVLQFLNVIHVKANIVKAGSQKHTKFHGRI